jgi:uncharacterized protein
MELTGVYRIPAAREAVWDALNDPEILRECIAGCEAFAPEGENVWRVVVTASVGPVKARFASKITLTDIDRSNAYTLNFDGQGGTAGFGKGSARVSLSDDGADTQLSYTAKAQVGGKLAQVGSRLIDGAAAKVAADFFEKFSARLGGGREEAPVAAALAGGLGQPDTHFPLLLKILAPLAAIYVLVTLIRGV